MKKKLLSLVLTLCLTATLLPGAVAQGTGRVVALKLDSSWCVVGDQVTQVDEGNREVAPYAKQVNGGGYTLLPIRRVLEAFGGTIEWVQATNGVLCSLNGRQVELTPGSDQAMVDGSAVTMEVAAEANHDRTFVPVRFVSENLGLYVAYVSAYGIVAVSDSPLSQDQAALAALPAVERLRSYTTPAGDPLSFRSESFALPSGSVSANIVTVDMSDPRVSVRTAMVGNKLNATADFAEIVASSGADVVINGNFFESYQDIKDPSGPVMADGQFLYGNSGALSSLGFTADNRMYYGRPAVFYRVRTTDAGPEQNWSGYNINVFDQSPDVSVVYTPARGSSVPVTCDGAALTVQGGVTTGYWVVTAGQALTIPADGYVLWMGSGFISTHYFQVPEMGRTVALEPYLFTEDAEGFQIDGVRNLVSGGPRLVQDGAMVTTLEPVFQEARFTTSVTPRTVIGTTADGKLLLVNTPAASIQQLRELMLRLGCVDAFNLDGGASTAMWYRGSTVAAPGRQLTVTLQVSVAE